MLKTMGLLVWSVTAFTLTKGARAFDSSSSVVGAFDWYLEIKSFNSACCAAVKASPVTGSLKNEGDETGVFEKITVKWSVPGFLSSVRLFTLSASSFGK